MGPHLRAPAAGLSRHCRDDALARALQHVPDEGAATRNSPLNASNGLNGWLDVARPAIVEFSPPPGMTSSEITSFGDDGFYVRPGDEMNGFGAEGRCDTWIDVERWLDQQVRAHSRSAPSPEAADVCR